MDLLSFVVVLIILGLAFWLIIWLVDWIGLPEPFNKIIKAVVAIVFVLYLLGALLGGAPLPTIRLR